MEVEGVKGSKGLSKRWALKGRAKQAKKEKDNKTFRKRGKE